MGQKWLWAALAGLIVVGVGWYFYDRAAEYRYQSTGDELLDRYAVQFLSDLQESLEHPPRFDDSGHFPERFDMHSALLLESWEAEYCDDPRYWQLRAMATPYGGDEQTFGGGGAAPLTVTKLPELIEGGMTDEGLFALVDYRKLYAADSEQALRLIRRATELYGDNAHFHYLQAALELKAGRPDAAWAALSKGNTAPRNAPPAVYPVSPACVDPDLFRGSRDNRAFYMTWITNYESSNELPDHLLIKDFVKLALEEYPTYLTPGILDQFLLMSQRCILREDRPVIRLPLGCSLINSLLQSAAARSLADNSGNSTELQVLLDNNKRALEVLQRRLNETISQGDVAGQRGEENWDIEYERHLGNGEFLDAEVYPLLEPLGEPVFTTWATAAGLDPAHPVQ